MTKLGYLVFNHRPQESEPDVLNEREEIDVEDKR